MLRDEIEKQEAEGFSRFLYDRLKTYFDEVELCDDPDLKRCVGIFEFIEYLAPRTRQYAINSAIKSVSGDAMNKAIWAMNSYDPDCHDPADIIREILRQALAEDPQEASNGSGRSLCLSQAP